MSLFPAAAREIEELHAVFAAWLGDAGRRDAGLFARIEAALAPDFAMVVPDGRRLARAKVLAALAAGEGAHGPGFAIRIENVALVAEAPGLVAAIYDEVQSGMTGPSHRRSTALFRAAPDGPNGLRWAAVHETWIAGA